MTSLSKSFPEASNTFFWGKTGKQRLNVTLKSNLTLELAGVDKNRWMKAVKKTIPLVEVISVSNDPADADRDDNGQAWHTRGEGANLISIKYMKRNTKNHNIWLWKSVIFRHEDQEVVSKWRRVLSEGLQTCLQWRPKQLLVVINPYGGRKKARRIFEKKVKPIFDLAHIKYLALETEYAGHGFEIVMQHDLTTIDGIVSVGGDGMFNEIFNGLLRRVAASEGVDVNDSSANLVRPQIRVGVIPGGSTDSLALGIHGTTDPVTAALHIVLGDERGLDVASVYAKGKLERFSMTMASYGYFGDLVLRSESCRGLGPKRYDWSGIQTFFANKSYKGIVTYTKEENLITDPKDQVKCSQACNICSIADDGQAKLVTITREGKFMKVSGCHMTCCSQHTKLGISPGAHFGDGNTDLILVEECSRIQYLRYLFRVAYHFNSPFALSNVEVHRVKEFTFTHVNKSGAINKEDSSGERSPKSVWNIDGEIQTETDIHIKMNRQLISVFGRGPEDLQTLQKHLENAETLTSLIEDMSEEELET